MKNRLLNQSLGELNRLGKQPGPIILGIVWIVLLVGMFVFNAALNWSDHGAVKNYKSPFSFPLDLRYWGELLSAFSPYFCLVLVVLVLGGDFQLSILKMSLPKCRRRSEYLWAKLIAIFTYLFALTAISCGLALLSGLIGSYAIHQPVRLTDGLPAGMLPGLMLVSVFSMFLYGVVTALAILLSRSSIAGMLAGMFFLPFLNLMAKFSPKAAWMTPLHHLGNIEARLVNVGRLKVFQEEYGDYGVTLSISFLVAFVGLIFFFIFRRFQRMDFDANP